MVLFTFFCAPGFFKWFTHRLRAPVYQIFADSVEYASRCIRKSKEEVDFASQFTRHNPKNVNEEHCLLRTLSKLGLYDILWLRTDLERDLRASKRAIQFGPEVVWH
jgi:hypothetical protein